MRWQFCVMYGDVADDRVLYRNTRADFAYRNMLSLLRGELAERAAKLIMENAVRRGWRGDTVRLARGIARMRNRPQAAESDLNQYQRGSQYAKQGVSRANDHAGSTVPRHVWFRQKETAGPLGPAVSA